MYLMLTILVSISQLLFKAQVSSFGCNSSKELADLQRIRSDPSAFQNQLYTLVVYGQCIAIARGAVVEGAIEQGDSTVLRINAETSPPGYMVPARDFKRYKAQAKK
jgi:hypothetical protein